MDICLGNSNAYISILIKRATIEDNNDILTERNMLIDSKITNEVLNFCNLDNSNLTYAFSKCVILRTHYSLVELIFIIKIKLLAKEISLLKNYMQHMILANKLELLE